MKELVAYIAQSLVDHPSEVKTVQTDEEDSITIELTVAQDDLGKIIGKQGRTARAIRSILAAAAGKENKRSRLDILE
jgi:uncharacterized protein